MALGITGNGNAKGIAELGTHVFDEIKSAGEATLGSLPLVLSFGRVAAKGDDIANSTIEALLQSVADDALVHVGAREVHVGHVAIVVHVKGQVQRKIGSGTASAPGNVGEQR